jgi:hypothetical protein
MHNQDSFYHSSVHQVGAGCIPDSQSDLQSEEDGDSEVLQNVGKTAYICTVPSPLNRIHIMVNTSLYMGSPESKL